MGGVAEILNKPTIPAAQGLQNVITTNNILTQNNTVAVNSFGLTFDNTNNFVVNSTNAININVNSESKLQFQPTRIKLFQTTAGVDNNVSVTSTGVNLNSVNAGATQLTSIGLTPTEIKIGTPNVTDGTASVGEVLTLINAATGEVEFTTPTTGGGILHGTAAGTDTFTVSIAGVVSYSDGDAFLVRFTNGNTSACTLNINGIGAIPLHRNNDGALIGGDIWAGAEMLCIYNSTLSVFQCIGTSSNSLFAYVTNAEPSTTITKGQPVYAFGGTGDRLTVKLAFNTTDSTSAQTVGMVVSTSIAPNQKGIIIVAGQLDNLSTLPTSTFADGDAIYLGATAGSITNVKPYAPNHLVYLGFVTTASPGNAGRMYVRVQNGYELNELHNVVATAPVNNDYMYYDSSTSLYRLRQLTASLITDSTTVGQNLVTLPNPSAVRYLRINADNTVSALTLAQLKTDLSVGTDISVVLGSNVTNVGTGFEDVTGLSFAVTAGKTYKWRATISYALTGGALITFSSNGPTASLNNARFTTTTALTTNTISNQALYDTGTNAVASANGLSTADGIFRVTASGTWTIRFRCSVGGNLTVRAGTVVEYSEVL